MTSLTDTYKELAALAERFTAQDGEYRTAIEGLGISRRTTPSIPCHSSYRPCLAMVLQGAKSLRLGSETINYTKGEYLVTSLDLPVTWRVVEASPEAPHLCLALAINSEKLTDLIGRADVRRHMMTDGDQWGITVNAAPTGLLDAVLRLLRLLDNPEDIPVMAPLIEQEILYRLLTGPAASA